MFRPQHLLLTFSMFTLPFETNLPPVTFRILTLKFRNRLPPFSFSVLYTEYISMKIPPKPTPFSFVSASSPSNSKATSPLLFFVSIESCLPCLVSTSAVGVCVLCVIYDLCFFFSFFSNLPSFLLPQGRFWWGPGRPCAPSTSRPTSWKVPCVFL